MVELLVTLAVAAIIVTAAVPNYRDMVSRNRITTLTNDVAGSLNIARSEAVKRGVTVTVCKSSDQVSCTGIWNDGWIVFADADGDRVVDAGIDELIRVYSNISDGRSLNFSGSVSNDYLQYLSTGFTAGQSGTFSVCGINSDLKYARAIIVSPAGRPRQSTDSNSDSVHEDLFGINLTCP